jgi:pilus assembly protein CpaB
MLSKRLLAALLIALIVSGLFTWFLSRRVARATHVDTPQKQFYVATKEALDGGETLKAENLQLLEWHASTPLLQGFSKIDTVAGRVALYPLAKGQPVIEGQLAAVGAGAGLTAKIPTGMRAISVRSDDFVGVGGFLLPGTHVDVLMTSRSNTSPDPRTSTVLQDVVVLAAGQQIHPDPAGKPVSVNVVTLLLEPEDAEKVVLATSLGGMYFVLRNGSDRDQLSTTPVGLGQLTDSDSPPAPTAAASSVRPVPVVPKQYKVETFLGDKRIVNNFN